ncbi:hypothetical protein KEM52_001955 [Ascosphaera acerosa]|nr:hypothetical protein KEM52_001955 [Ascosphaera acerosa]
MAAERAENSAQEGLPQLYEGAGTYVRYSGRALSLSLGGLSQSHCLNDDGSTCPGFYDESLALHRDMDLTVFNARLGQETAQLSQAVEEADAWVARSNLALSAALPPPLPGDFTPLDQLPRLCASSPYPHVPPTVNLIAGVLAVQPRTRVRTRYGKDMDFIEMLLGDETVRDAAGLTMTFWLDPSGVPPDGRAGDDVSSPTNTLESYHRGDVLYLRHVALRVFEGRVYAQSLRNNATKVHLYHRWIYTSSAPGAAAGSRPGSGCEPGRYTTKMLMGVARDGREDAHAQRTGDAATAADAGWRCHPHLRKLAAVVDFVKRTIASTVNVEGESSLAA